jgi:hypothetical protein
MMVDGGFITVEGGGPAASLPQPVRLPSSIAAKRTVINRRTEYPPQSRQLVIESPAFY